MLQRIKFHSVLLSFVLTYTLAPFYSFAGEANNMTDANGLRQGYWKITGELSTEEGFRDDQVVEEGTYENNKKTGIWKKFFPSGSLRNEITFMNNVPRGPYKIYYENGSLEEEGNWQGNKNIGVFKRFHENGNLAQDFTFLPNGKRDGTQSYFYENGKNQLTVEVKEGVAHGAYKVYYPNGKIKVEKTVVEGKVDESTVKEYKSREEFYDDFEAPNIPERIVVDAKNNSKPLEVFDKSGENTLYNRRKQVTQSGEFKNGRLWNGKWHRYDRDGKLSKVEIYQEGKFAGYASLEDADK